MAPRRWRILALLAGAVRGFLVYNFPPASIFMGDCGSLLLGFSLAALTLSNEGVRGSRSDVLSVIAGPVFVLLIPIFDTTLVTVMRVLSGRSPAMGGRDHSSHRLVAIGLSERTAVLVLWLLAAIGGAIGVAVRSATPGMLAPGRRPVPARDGPVRRLPVARPRLRRRPPPPTSAAVTPLEGEFMYKRRVLEVLIDFCVIVGSYYAINQLLLRSRGVPAQRRDFYSSLPLVVAVAAGRVLRRRRVSRSRRNSPRAALGWARRRGRACCRRSSACTAC